MLAGASACPEEATLDIPTLTTERLVLRPFRLDDFEAYAAMSADPRVMRYIARGVTSHIVDGNAAAIRIAERLGARYAADADVQVNATPIRIYVYPDPG